MSKSNGSYAPDGAKYGTLTSGDGNLQVCTTSPKGVAKPTPGAKAPDGSIYFTLTNGQGTLV